MEEGKVFKKNPKVYYDESIAGNRRVMCNSDIKEGEIIIEEWFEVISMFKDNYDRACHYCLEEINDPKRCSICKYTHYCGKDHQTLDWQNGHKKECQLIKKISNNGERTPTAPLMMILKAFVQLEIIGNKQLLKNIESLKSPDENEIPSKRYEENRDNVLLIIKYHDDNFDIERIDRFTRYLDRMLINTVSVYSKTNPSNCLAIGLLKDFCRINHSCEPNCFSAFNSNKGIRIVSARNIVKGEEITFSYINNIDRLDSRRKKLQDEYFFHCECVKCLKEQGDSSVVKCKKVSETEECQALDNLKDIKEYVSSMEKRLEDMDPEWYLILNNVESALVALKEFKYLYNFRLKYTKRFETWFSGIMNNPIVGQHFNNLGRLCNQLELAKETFIYCSKSYDIFSKYFEGQLMNELEVMIDDSRAFLDMQTNSNS